MTVAEMIEWLKTQPQEAIVVIEDADTGWFLLAFPGCVRDWNYEDQKELPDEYDAVVIHGDYSDQVKLA